MEKARRSRFSTFYENNLSYSILKEYSLSKREKTISDLAPNEELVEESDDRTFATIKIKKKDDDERLASGKPGVVGSYRVERWSINTQKESVEILDKIYSIQRLKLESDDWSKAIIEAFPFLKSKEEDFKTKAFQEELWQTSELLEEVLANGWERVYLVTVN